MTKEKEKEKEKIKPEELEDGCYYKNADVTDTYYKVLRKRVGNKKVWVDLMIGYPNDSVTKLKASYTISFPLYWIKVSKLEGMFGLGV